MKIALRQKRLNGGNASLYLDYYEKGWREYEFLDLYLVPDGAADARRLNEATLQKAAAIKAERTLNPDGRLGGKRDKAARDKAASTPRLTEWIQTVHDMKARAGFSKSVLCTTIHIKALVGEYLAFAKKRDPRIGMVDKGFLVGFLQYLKNGHANVTCRNSVRPLAEGSLRQYRQQMVAILNAAVNEGIIERNPFSDLGSRDTFATPVSSRVYLTIDELKSFMNARCESGCAGARETRMAFIFACFTGLRISDIRSLRWCDIQGINGIPHVRTTMAKTRKVILVPLSMNAMLWIPRREKGTRDTDHVFARLPERSGLNDSVRRLAKAAGIGKHITFHTSRHTFATLTLKACKDLYVVSKLLGHASVNTTRVYADVMDSTLEDAVAKLEGILGKASAKDRDTSVSP